MLSCHPPSPLLLFSVPSDPPPGRSSVLPQQCPQTVLPYSAVPKAQSPPPSFYLDAFLRAQGRGFPAASREPATKGGGVSQLWLFATFFLPNRGRTSSSGRGEGGPSSYPGASQGVISRPTLFRHNPFSRGGLDPHSLGMGRGSLRKALPPLRVLLRRVLHPRSCSKQGENEPKRGQNVHNGRRKNKKVTYTKKAICKKKYPKAQKCV